MDAGGDGGVAGVVDKPLANGEQLDGEAGLRGGRDVVGGDVGDALGVDIVIGDAGVEAHRRHDRGLGGGVVSFNIGGGVGLGVAQALSLIHI